MSKKNHIFIMSLGVLLGVCLSIGGSVFAERGDVSGTQQVESLPYEDLRTFTEIFGRIKKIMSNRFLIKNCWKERSGAC